MTKILVADDEVTIREYIRYVVKEQNLPVDIYEAGSGKEAIEKARELWPHIILMDIRMPEMSGLEAARIIKQFCKWTRIIILTAYDEFAYIREALRLGVDDYLLKPISPRDLVNVVERTVKGDSVAVDDNRAVFIEDMHLESRLVESVKFNRREDAFEVLDHLLAEDRIDCHETGEMKRYIIELTGVIVRSIASLGIDAGTAVQLKEDSQKRILAACSAGEVKEHMKRFLSDIIEVIGRHCLSPNEKVAIKAGDYIRQHYARKIYLKDAADHVGLSPCYFSRVFKQCTGRSFSRYVNEVRIKQAKEYIRNFDISLGEISRRVGYEDFSYFSSVFCKLEGCLPSQFRRRVKEEKDK